MRQPLEGVRVLDLGQIYQGPYCGMILSFMGAEVIKIERPNGETVRDRSEAGETPEVQFLNPNKRGVTLNLKQPEGVAVLKDLVAEADVLVENFAVGKMEALGVGYDQLREVNPALIYAHGSGYGDTGPYTSYPAMDLTIQAMGGVMHTTGFSDSPPVKAGPAFSDFMGGIHLAAGILAALYQRELTGDGEYVEVGMLDCIYPTLASPIASWIKQIDAPSRTGNKHSGMAIAPYNVYEASNGYLAIICISERHWRTLAELMDHSEFLEDERYASKSKRADHVDEIDELVSEWVADKKRDELVDVLLDSSVPCAPVQTTEDVVTDPQLEHRGMLNYVENRGTGRDKIPIPGMPIKFRGGDEPAIRPSPTVGEHTEEVLKSIAGYDDERIDELRQNDVFGSESK